MRQAEGAVVGSQLCAWEIVGCGAWRCWWLSGVMGGGEQAGLLNATKVRVT